MTYHILSSIKIVENPTLSNVLRRYEYAFGFNAGQFSHGNGQSHVKARFNNRGESIVVAHKVSPYPSIKSKIGFRGLPNGWPLDPHASVTAKVASLRDENSNQI